MQRYRRGLHEAFIEQLDAALTDTRIEDARKTFSRKTSWATRIGDLVSGTSLEPIAEHVDFTYVSPFEYEDNPAYGIMNKDQYDRLRATRRTIHAYRTLELLDQISFEPPGETGYPENGIVSLEWAQRAARMNVSQSSGAGTEPTDQPAIARGSAVH